MTQPPRAVLDACVLFPTILREILLDVAAAGLFAPVWSDHLLAEWTRAAARLGADAAAIAGAEAALARLRFPDAAVTGDAARALSFDLPDPGDRHVLATALAADAGLIVTANLRDFPRDVMQAAGLRALHPDAFLLDMWHAEPAPVAEAARAAHARALAAGGTMTLREMLKRARLPRLAKVLT